MKDTPYGMIAANMVGKGFRHSVSVADKERLRKKMQDFESFLEQNPFVQKKKEEGIEIGIEQGREEGEIKAFQKAVVTIIEGRFPALVELAQRKVTNINKIDALALMIRMVSTAPDTNPQSNVQYHTQAEGHTGQCIVLSRNADSYDEATARFILNTKVA